MFERFRRVSRTVFVRPTRFFGENTNKKTKAAAAVLAGAGVYEVLTGNFSQLASEVKERVIGTDDETKSEQALTPEATVTVSPTPTTRPNVTPTPDAGSYRYVVPAVAKDGDSAEITQVIPDAGNGLMSPGDGPNMGLFTAVGLGAFAAAAIIARVADRRSRKKPLRNL